MEESLYSEKVLHSAPEVALDYGNAEKDIGSPRKEVDSVRIYTITLAPLLHPTLSSMKQGVCSPARQMNVFPAFEVKMSRYRDRCL